MSFKNDVVCQCYCEHCGNKINGHVYLFVPAKSAEHLCPCAEQSKAKLFKNSTEDLEPKNHSEELKAQKQLEFQALCKKSREDLIVSTERLTRNLWQTSAERSASTYAKVKECTLSEEEKFYSLSEKSQQSNQPKPIPIQVKTSSSFSPLRKSSVINEHGNQERKGSNHDTVKEEDAQLQYDAKTLENGDIVPEYAAFFKTQQNSIDANAALYLNFEEGPYDSFVPKRFLSKCTQTEHISQRHGFGDLMDINTYARSKCECSQTEPILMEAIQNSPSNSWKRRSYVVDDLPNHQMDITQNAADNSMIQRTVLGSSKAKHNVADKFMHYQNLEKKYPEELENWEIENGRTAKGFDSEICEMDMGVRCAMTEDEFKKLERTFYRLKCNRESTMASLMELKTLLKNSISANH